MNVSTTKHRLVNRDGGFTLMELMITVAVLGILVAVAFPSYRNHVIRGHRTAAKAVMMEIANREQQYLLANRSYADKAALLANGFVVDAEIAARYSWTLTADNTATPPTFLITFMASGPQISDGNLTLDSVGTKLPAEKWSR